jgi:hypothetical protein
MSIRKLFWVYISAMLSVAASAQQLLPKVEGWRVHASFVTNNCLQEVNNKIVVGNNSTLFTVDKATNEMEIVSRVNGLSDVKAQYLAYHSPSQTIVVGYDNLNIDLIQNGMVYNIPDMLNKVIIGEKTLNNITIDGNKAYLACSFGIVVVDIVQKRIIDSYVNLGANGSNLPVSDVALYNGKIYASSPDGIYAASLSSFNLSDFNFWSQLKSSSFSSHMEVFRNRLYAVIDSTIQTYDGNTWSPFNGLGMDQTNAMRVTNNQLVITLQNQIVIEQASGSVRTVNQRFANDCIVSKEGDLFFLVPEQYLLRMDAQTQIIDYLAPAGPYATTATRMVYSDGILWTAAGQINGFGVTGGWGPKYNNNKFYRFQDNTWYSYKGNPSPYIENWRDFVDVAVHPVSKHAFFGSFGFGILEMSGEQVVAFYDSTNSSLRSPIGGLKVVNVAGLAFDEAANLWVSNSDAPNPLSVRSKDGAWKSFSFPSDVNSDGRMGFITLDDVGNKWIFSTRANGIYVYNSGTTVLDERDDQVKRMTKQAGAGLLPSEAVFCITKDKQGEMWVGTDNGLCIFGSAENIFKTGGSYDARQIVIKSGSGFANFLGSTAVYCIRVDAANRKWIGTSNGVWLVSPDGYTVVKNFTTSNSPLLSNSIIEIGINDATGEVFFVTEKGMISYMGTATEGGDTHGDVLVYPNPVKPDYNGLIAIRGLVNNAFVKITDIKGQLVYETRANGGTATWDGNTFSGKRAATGVYLIYSSNDDGTDTNVAKLLFIN